MSMWRPTNLSRLRAVVFAAVYLPAVLASAQNASDNSQAASSASPDRMPPRGSDGEPALYFGEIVLPDRPVFVGELIPAELLFYFRGDQQFENLQPPTFGGEGFASAPLVGPERAGRFVGKVPYNVVAYRTAITPSDAGGVNISSATIKGRLLHAATESGLVGFFKSLLRRIPFLGYDGGEDIEVATQARILEVRPLPVEGRPEKFSGAIGQFTMNTSADPLTTAPGQPLMLRVSIQGRGNFQAMEAPHLIAVDGWRTNLREPVIQTKDTVGFEGLKTFEFSLLALEDRSETPAAAFSFFDPFAQKYVLLEAPPIQVTALGAGMDAEADTPSQTMTPEEEKAADMRIPDIDRSGQLPKQRKPTEVGPGEKFRFGSADQEPKQAAMRPEARLTMRDRIVRLLTALKVSGITESSSGWRVLLGPLILSEGIELPRLFAGQVERVKVQAIERDENDKDVLMVLFEMGGTGQSDDLQPFVVQVNLRYLQPSTDSLLFGELFEKLVPFGEKGSPMLDPLKLPSVGILEDAMEEQELQSVVERRTEMMNAPALKEADDKAKK